MSNYPMWWNTTITIFNKYENPQTQVITWYKTIVKNCFWQYVGDKITINQTVLDTNSIICRIPENDKFLEKYQWVNIPNDKMGDYFTLGNGDIIVRGEVDDTIDEYRSGMRSTDLIAKYKDLQGCMEVQRIAIDVGGGRNNPHYYVRGI